MKKQLGSIPAQMPGNAPWRRAFWLSLPGVRGVFHAVLLIVPVSWPAAWPAAAHAQGQEALCCTSVDGVLLSKSATKPWRALKPGASVPDATTLVSLFQAEMTSADKAVGVKLMADIGQRGPYPVLDTGIIVHQAKDCDLDVTLQRGILVVANLRDQGPVRIHLRIRGNLVQCELKEPQTRLGIELYGRHAPGRASLDEDDPVTYAFVLVLKGEVLLSHKDKSISLKEPPGPALLLWDSLQKNPEVQVLDKLPFSEPLSTEKRDLFAAMCTSAGKLAVQDIPAAVATLVKSDSRLDRLVGVTALGAVDDVAGLAEVLEKSPDAEVRDHAILVLRNWLGRAPGQMKAFIDLLAKKDVPQPRAKSVLHLLVGFTTEERAMPDTYELLIECLNHPKQAVRALAYWHLVRLAPAGKDILYNASAPEGQRLQGQAQWRVLIPSGKLPPPAKKAGSS